MTKDIDLYQESQHETTAGVTAAVTALCLIQFIDVMSVTVVVTALLQMLADVGASPGDSTLVATGYAMFFGGLLMVGARLGDRIGHRRTIIFSLGLFALGALLAAVATSAAVLIVARCLQGAAAAAAVPSALSLLTTITTTGRARDAAVAAWSAAGAAAGATGFVAGGLVTQTGSWRLIFWLLLAIPAFQALAVLLLVRDRAPQADRPALNLFNGLLLTASAMLLVVGTTLLGTPEHRSIGWLLLAICAVGGLMFVRRDLRSSAPFLPPALLGRSTVRRGVAVAFINTATTTGVATLITLYLQETLGRSPLAAAAVLLPFSVAVVVGSTLSTRLSPRWSRDTVTVIGLTVIALGIALPLIHPSLAWLIGVGMAISGLGLGLTSVMSTAMATDVPTLLRTAASGLVNTSAQLGAAIGTAVVLLTATATTGVPAPQAQAPRIAWGATAVVALLSAIAITATHHRMTDQDLGRGSS
jgi:MFS family permease